MIYAIGVLGVVFAVGAFLLARFIAKGGGPRTGLWCGLLVPFGAFTLFLAQLVTLYYKIPVGWLVVVGLAVAVVVALLVRIGLDVKWQALRVVALVGLLLATFATLIFVMIAVPMGNLFVPLFEIRAQQIGEACGFETLMAPDETLVTEYRPVDPLAEPDAGVSIQYKNFQMQERVSDGPMSAEELKQLVAEGEDPLGFGGPGIPEDVEYTTLEVRGNPAVAATYETDPMEGGKPGIAPDAVRVLVFETDGIEVRMLSQGWLEYKGIENGEEVYEPVAPLSLGEMTEIAESLEPMN